MSLCNKDSVKNYKEEITINDLLQKRHDDLFAWLSEYAPDCVAEQRHLDKGTSEQVYWHYGYLLAIKDVLAIFNNVNKIQH